MRFGVLLAPHHRLGLDPTLAMHRDIELAAHLDRMGYDELWYGEHHSGGVETLASPEIMIAAAAQHTQRLRLGTSVVSLPYHNPFMVADRIVQLDHLTRGRMIAGFGPGQLLADAKMIGIEPSSLRTRMEESLEVIVRLFAGETVTAKTDWFTLEDAVLQFPRYSDFEICVASVISPAGPSVAGRFGASLLSLAATDPVGVEWLSRHWEILEAEAAAYGHTADRSKWRLVGPVHIAETVEQAQREVMYGMPWIMNYMSHISPTSGAEFDDPRELIRAVNDSGRAVIGTPDMAVDLLSRLRDKSGGFGTYLTLGADFARWDAKLRSYELFAEEVVPRMNGQLDVVKASVDRVFASGKIGAEVTTQSQIEAAQRYERRRSDRNDK